MLDGFKVFCFNIKVVEDVLQLLLVQISFDRIHISVQQCRSIDRRDFVVINILARILVKVFNDLNVKWAIGLNLINELIKRIEIFFLYGSPASAQVNSYCVPR